MIPKDKEFLQAIVKGATDTRRKPPFEMSISVYNVLVRKFYEYGTEKSTKNKMQGLVKDGLFEPSAGGFRITEAGEKIGFEK